MAGEENSQGASTEDDGKMSWTYEQMARRIMIPCPENANHFLEMNNGHLMCLCCDKEYLIDGMVV